LRFLTGTNIWLEILLKQERSGEAKSFLDRAEKGSVCISDFSLYSIGISFFDANQHELFLRFVEDLLVRGAVEIIRNEKADFAQMADASKTFRLDFDDAYQYAAAEKYNLTMVSFDSDFDRTRRGRKTPGQALKLK